MITNALVQDKSTHTIEKPVILVVDDSRVIRLALKKMLQNEYTLIEAGDGEEAWKLLLDNEAIQVVFSDLSLPELDGFELLARIRSSELERVSKIPFILLTSNEDDEKILQQAEEYGVTDLIAKPFQSEEIKDRARTYTRNLTDSEIHSFSTPSFLDEIADSVDNLSSIDDFSKQHIEEELASKLEKNFVRRRQVGSNTVLKNEPKGTKEENEAETSKRSPEYSENCSEKSDLALKIEEHTRHQQVLTLVRQADETLVAFDVNQRLRSNYKDGQGSMEETEMIRHALEKKLATEREKKEASCTPRIRFFVSVLERINTLKWMHLGNIISNILKRNAR